MQQDFEFMARALELARRGWYTTHPNPRVGCVIVKDGHILSEGWHAKAGAAHAEVAALQNIASAQGATAYVTLEPCSHFGKTPPCCDALIAAGITRVVAAMTDPNPLVSGAGFKRLEAAGIQLTTGILQDQAEALNRGFIQRMRTGLPWVRTKLAMSLDGRTATASGESKWITLPEARTDVQRLRAESSAILTGIETVLADDPCLNPRVEFEHALPIRVILDSHLRLPPTAKMRSQPGKILVFTGSEDRQKTAKLEDAGFEIHPIVLMNSRLDLKAVLTHLGKLQINELLIEAGPTLNGAMLEHNLLNEGIIYMAPSLLGDGGRGLFSMPSLHNLTEKKRVHWQEIRAVGTDLRLSFNFPN
jgi:diaminohydroxyphosphoribosylaminopyrimidine deaminase / 5-amino-6-(5-phosphoribosylamino)uracil reductase